MSHILLSSLAHDFSRSCFANLAATTVVQYLILAGAIILVAGIVMLWAAFFRKKPRTRRYRYERAKPALGEPVSAETKSERRRRRAEPRRNPTLAETRGLPPIRGEESDTNEHFQH